MNNKIKKTISIITIVILLFGAYFIGAKYPPSTLIKSIHTPAVFPKALIKDHTLLDRTADIIEDNYYKPVKEYDLIKGMVNSLNDPYSVFFTPEQAEEFQEEVQGEYAGIGVMIQENEKLKLPEIIAVFPNTPAEKVGLKKGDVIESADGVSLVGLSLDEVSMKVKGKIGTVVKLKIKRDDREIEVSVEREEIHIPLVETKLLKEGTIGYLKINMFSKGTAKQVASALKELHKQKVKGVILDLRNNPGGLLSECAETASYFIPGGPLLWEKGRTGEAKPLKIYGHRFDLPLVVLVNGGTASAAEILTSAIKDYKVGTIVGEKTFGKGVIQQLFTLPEGCITKVTIAEYLTANKETINKKGVEPDIVVKGNEAQLDEAIKLLEQK